MAWTEITRPQYDRRAYRYASDCSDEEWSLIEPFLVRRRKVGRPRRVIARRWGVERAFAWPDRCRRLAKDREASIASAEAWTLIASIRRANRFTARNMAS